MHLNFRESTAVNMTEEGNGATACHEEQNTATLFDASLKGHSESVAKLIEAGVDVNGRMGYHFPLTAAAKKGHSKCLELLIEAGADVNKDVGETTLGHAVKGRHEKCVNILLQAGADVNGSRYTTHTVLMAAAYGSIFEIFKALIDAGADVNTVTTAGNTALNEAARYLRRPCTKQMFQLLLKSGAHVNITDRRSLNALMRLALPNHDRLGDDEAILLFAAGERIKLPLVQRYVAEIIHLPAYMKPALCLKHLCRRAVTDYLLSIDEHNHLFGTIPRLGLPPSLARYLLFDMSLEE